MAGVSIVAKDKTFSSVIGRRPLTLEQRVFDVFNDRRAFRGAIYAPWDISTLFQDESGAVPVIADGDPVRLMLDVSGNGAHFVAPSDAARPIYKAGAQPYLQANGTSSDMRMVPAGLGMTSFKNQVSVSMGFLADSIATFRHLLYIRSSSNTPRITLGTGADAAQLRTFVRRKWDDADTELTLPKPSGIHLWKIFADFAGGFATLSRDVTAASDTESLPAAQISENPASLGVYLFSFAGTAYGNCRFYGGVILASEQDIAPYQADIDAYLAEKFGI